MSNKTLIEWNADVGTRFLTIHPDGSFDIDKDAPPLFVIGELAKAFIRQQDRIKQLEEAVVWQPIETAPTDMTWVIGYDAKDGEVGTIIFDLTGDVDDEDVHYEWTDGMRTWNPTHWMPLPEPPEAKEAKP